VEQLFAARVAMFMRRPTLGALAATKSMAPMIEMTEFNDSALDIDGATVNDDDDDDDDIDQRADVRSSMLGHSVAATTTTSSNSSINIDGGSSHHDGDDDTDDTIGHERTTVRVITTATSSAPSLLRSIVTRIRTAISTPERRDE